MSNNDIQPGDLTFDDGTIIEDVDLAETEILVGGERLTDERADAITAEVLAKVRTREATLIPGGKSLSGEGKHSPVIQTRVSETTRDKLKTIAAGRRMSVSKLSRQVLDDFVDSHDK